MSVLISAYLAMLIRLMPMVVCVVVGFIWGRRDQPYPTSFVSALVTYVAIPALTFHTLMTTPLAAGTMTWVLTVSVVALLVAGVGAGDPMNCATKVFRGRSYNSSGVPTWLIPPPASTTMRVASVIASTWSWVT